MSLLRKAGGVLEIPHAGLSDSPTVRIDKLARRVQSGEMLCTFPSIFAEAAGSTWPDGLDASLTAFYLTLLLGIPALGYVFMVVDFRRYLRSLRRALVVVSQVVPVMPYWSLLQRPTCLRTFGLELPCTEEEVLAAYRELAKTAHPDRGGDLQQFLQLQKHFEQALALVRDQ